MSKYRRAKREDAKLPPKKTLTITIGSADDSGEILETMCKDWTIELMKAIESINRGEEIEVIFWTADFPELIGISKVIKNEAGVMSFTFDYSCSTL